MHSATEAKCHLQKEIVRHGSILSQKHARLPESGLKAGQVPGRSSADGLPENAGCRRQMPCPHPERFRDSRHPVFADKGVSWKNLSGREPLDILWLRYCWAGLRSRHRQDFPWLLRGQRHRRIPPAKPGAGAPDRQGILQIACLRYFLKPQDQDIRCRIRGYLPALHFAKEPHRR